MEDKFIHLIATSPYLSNLELLNVGMHHITKSGTLDIVNSRLTLPNLNNLHFGYSITQMSIGDRYSDTASYILHTQRPADLKITWENNQWGVVSAPDPQKFIGANVDLDKYFAMYKYNEAREKAQEEREARKEAGKKSDSSESSDPESESESDSY